MSISWNQISRRTYLKFSRLDVKGIQFQCSREPDLQTQSLTWGIYLINRDSSMSISNGVSLSYRHSFDWFFEHLEHRTENTRNDSRLIPRNQEFPANRSNLLVWNYKNDWRHWPKLNLLIKVSRCVIPCSLKGLLESDIGLRTQVVTYYYERTHGIWEIYIALYCESTGDSEDSFLICE